MTSHTRTPPSIAPPRPHEGLFDKVMASLEKMTDEEVIEQGIRLGLYTSNGCFTERYGGGDARISPASGSALTVLERDVLTAILGDLRQHGVPPTADRVAKLVDTARPSQVLAALVRKGFLRQPYKDGPYIPLRNVDGSAVK